MIEIELNDLLVGLVVGSAMSALFFAGLSYGMQIALRAARPTLVLLVSAGLRFALLLAIGWVVAQAGAWAFFGYGVSFLVVRQLTLAVTRSRLSGDET